MPTSVPIFACASAEFNKLCPALKTRTANTRTTLEDATENEQMTEISHRADIAARYCRIDTLLDVTSKGLQNTDVIYRSLKAYFDNGGGYCYVTDTSMLATVMPMLPDVALLVAAGQNISSVTAQLASNNNQFIFGILDVPNGTTVTTAPLSASDDALLGTGARTAAYYPWLKASWSDALVPPSAAIAGIYCSVDRDRGVWKAPANISLQGGLVPVVGVSDAIQGAHTINKALNMIRTVGERQSVVWGARTRAPQNESLWIHVPVRRLFMSIEKDLSHAMSLAMFEPNNEGTWEMTRGAISNYLHSLWVAGALQGATEEEAYYVRVGKGVSMTDDDIKQGKLIVNVGVAAARPAEFIVLSMSQDVLPG